MAANPVHLNPPGEEPPPQSEGRAASLPDVIRQNSSANVIIAFVAIIAALHFAQLVFIVLFVSLLLAFVLEPVTRGFERIRLPRSVAALLAVLIFVGALYGLAYVSYNKAVDFAEELPRYSGEVRQMIGKVRKQAQTFEKSTQQVLPDDVTDKKTIKVQQQSSWSDKLFNGLGTATELIFAASFVPFLAYFMLSWKEHTRKNSVLLFNHQNRSTAYAALGAITEMIRAFIVGNFLVGLFIGALSTVIFGLMGLPYFYFIGFISGFLSLVPYLGVVVAAIPPLLTGVGHVHSSGFFIILGAVVGLHLFALNVLYPKFLGKRMQLNPLAVTVSLLFWGWVWGAMGLILAIPLTAAIKIICDHIESASAIGGWLGE
jgi:predicted PurR-regulated permease PerM